eukprot:g749.t1
MLARRGSTLFFRRWVSSAVDDRLAMWDRIAAESQKGASARSASEKIRVTLSKDGRTFAAAKGADSLADVLDESALANAVVAVVNGDLWDLSRPLVSDCDVELFDVDSEIGRETLWHSAAHVAGHALELRYGDVVQLCDGPALRSSEGGQGFFYEMFMKDGRRLTEDDFPDLMKDMKKIVKGRQPFLRMRVTREEALVMFEANPFKKQIILENIDTSSTDEITLYRCGSFVDLCRGPHVPHTGLIRTFDLLHSAGAHCARPPPELSSSSPQLQRVYGIAFGDKKAMKTWRTLQREARRRDHRTLGAAQSLFMFHSSSPGSVFWLPHGQRIFQTLLSRLRRKYRMCGYSEVATPLMLDSSLWKRSGHWDHYSENMYAVVPAEAEPAQQQQQQLMGLKPMNCPAHCLVYQSASRSYRELPFRVADFTTLHRNELSGALGGLTRVRQFHQDDAHIFCAPQQIQAEISSCLEFVNDVYGAFDLKPEFRLSTRPSSFVGDAADWDVAENALRTSLEASNLPWTLNAGDGAFYGPKIDVAVLDALERRHQCATVQLDFQLPKRFDLKFKADDGELRTPVLIHRAVLGSLERFVALIIEHTAGKWPFWLSPRQFMVVPVAESHETYARGVADRLLREGFAVETDLTSNTLNKKIRNAQVGQFNHALVVGDREMSTGMVNVRNRDGSVRGEVSLDELVVESKESIRLGGF